MRRKLCKLFCCALFLFLFSCSSVLAEKDPSNATTSNEGNNIIYDVYNFGVSDNLELSISGMTFIDHMDNYGGKNLKVYLVFYKGDWNKEWDKSIDSVKNQRYYVKIESFGALNLYKTRCYNYGVACKETHQTAVEKEVAAGKYRNNACLTSKQYKIGSDCVYNNLSFNFEYSLIDVFKNFDSGSVLKIRILARVKYNRIDKKFDKEKPGNVYASIDMGAFETAYQSKIEKSVENDQIYYNVNVSAPSKKFYFTATKVKVDGVSGCYYDANQVYDVKSVSGANGGNRKVTLYTSKYKNSGCKVKNGGRKKCVSSKCGNDVVLLSYGHVGSSIELTVSKSKYNPSDSELCHCIGGDCPKNADKNNKNCRKESKSSLSCTNTQNSFNYCKNDTKTVNCTFTIDKTYYYKINKSELGSDQLQLSSIDVLGSEGIVEDEVGNYYIPVLFSTNINAVQEVSVKPTIVLNDNKNYVLAGRPINFNLEYSNKVNWNGVSLTTNSTTERKIFSENNFYKTLTDSIKSVALKMSLVDVVSSGGCPSGYSYNKDLEKCYKYVTPETGESSNNIIYFRFANDDILYDGTGSSGKKVKYINIYSDMVNKYSSDISKRENDDISFEFPDSNDVNNIISPTYSSDSCKNIIPNGSNSFTRECEYKIKPAYLLNEGPKDLTREILYSTEYFVDGIDNIPDKYIAGNRDENGVPISEYYTPLGYNGLLDFAYSSDNISLLNEMKFEVNTTCSINVMDPFDPPSDGPIKGVIYRVISLDNPFPKVNLNSFDDYPLNWRDYVKSNGLSRITNMSFDNVYYYTNKSLGSSLNLDSITNDVGEYSYPGDLDTNGYSSLVDNRFITHGFGSRNIIHCKRGEFSDSCDRIS